MSSEYRKLRILSVDDEPRNLRIMTEVFDCMADHVTAPDARTAIQLVELCVPDVILLDLMLPDMDGYELCRELRVRCPVPSTRIVIVSVKSSVSERLMGYEAGADDYVTKPFVIEELRAKVDSFRRMRNLELQLADSNRELGEMVKVRTEQLRTTQPAAWIGMNAAQVLHNIGNDLTILKGALGLLSRESVDAVLLERMTRSVERIWEMSSDIVGFVRPDAISDEDEDLDINEILQQEMKILYMNPFFRKNVAVAQSLAKLPLWRGKRWRLAQVFGNLLRNALEAMHKVSSPSLSLLTIAQGDWIGIKIRDNGEGMSDEVKTKIFDPYFTTKPAKSKDGSPVGTGLGLSSVKAIVESYGGEIIFESELKVGTCATVRIPTGR